MPSPRTRPFVMPRAVQDAPLDALRSHRVPIYPESFGPGAEEMRNPPPRVWLSSKMAQQGNVKDQDGNYRYPNAPALEYVELRHVPTMALTQRLTAPRSPMEPMAELSQAFQDELWTQIHTVEPLNGPAVTRSLPYPGRLPGSFEELDEFDHFVATQRQVERHEHRMDALREIRRSDDMIAEIMGEFRR